MGNLEKNAGNFSPIILIVTLKSAQKSNWGKIYYIFSPSVFIFSPLGHAIIFLLSQTVYWGENIARGKSNHIFHAEHNLFLWQYLSWGQLLGYELDEKQYNIFPPGPVFFPTCDRKTCKKINGGKKNGIFSHFHIFPPWTMLYLVPLLRQLRYWGAWKWWYLLLAWMYILLLVNSMILLWIILIIALSTISFFPVYFYQLPFSLLP